MIKPFIITREDYCMHCNTEHALECYDFNNNPIGFDTILNLYYNNKSIVIRKELSYMKCKKCNTKYMIDWSNDRSLPKPLIYDDDLCKFLNNYYKGE